MAAALAMQQALVQAIAKAEKSVVAIARVKSQFGGPNLGGAEFNPFREPRPLVAAGATADPTSPDFIPTRFGSGVVVDRNGLILPNYHVIDELFMSEEEPTEVASDLYVWAISWKAESPRPMVYPAKIKAADPRSDLALLEIQAESLEPIRFANIQDAERELKKGQIAIALGNPYAIAKNGSPSASWGIISNIARKLGPEPDLLGEPAYKNTLHHFGTLIQTDAKLNLGTSGGALINLKGEMIGLTTSQAALAGYEQAAGYAIPVDDLFHRVVETLKKGREVEYGFLGVRPRNLNYTERLRGLQGMVIESVQQGTPAFGKLNNSDVILAVNGKPVYDADGLVLNVGKLPVGEVVRLTIRGRRDPVEIPLSKYPVRGRKIVPSRDPAWRGLRVDYPSANEDLVREPLSHQWNALIEGGVGITEVEQGSPAADAGLQAGGLISHVDNIRVQTPNEFRDAVTGKKGKVKIRMGDVLDETKAIRTIDTQ